MKIRKAVLFRLAAFTFSILCIILNIYNFIRAVEVMLIWKMLLSAIGCLGFLWIAIIILQQLKKPGAENH